MQKTSQNSRIVRFDPPGKKILDARFIPIVPDVEEKFTTGFANAVGSIQGAAIFNPAACAVEVQGLTGLINGEIDAGWFAEAAGLVLIGEVGKDLF